MKKMIKTIQVMLIPNNKQKTKLFQYANTARYAYNWALGREKENYKNDGKFLSDGELRKEFTQLKKTDEYSWLNERFSKEGDRVYTFPDTDAWLVLERKGENAIQVRMTDEKGVIVSWDNYEVMNASVKQIESVRLSVSGRSRISFSPAEIYVIDRYGDYDRQTTMGKLDILLGRFRDEVIAKNALSVIDKLGRISDKSYTDMYHVGQKRIEADQNRSLGNRLVKARIKADKQNSERANGALNRRKGISR